MSQPAETDKRKIIYTGNVQGVGFRFTTRRIARRFPVTGTVRNLADGTVELVVEGSPAVVDEFLADVAARFVNNIERCQSAEFASDESFRKFQIIR
ncbi:MAG: acylphosphatase [Planctomycetaceae bacterium]|jgi:acylphosphatase|nr:acylphosphatase [Planctomycetaceae bacterium]MBT6153075.1 acylphosphatase [Planctomycetaceae bacterium]MBT6487938.1 acylphosphatase [Planctomycetaceae bacterium]MBT6498025.1 acylphosphatase [Planctomycetaceae bacterium]